MDETAQFEPMSVGQIIDRAFRLYRRNFLQFIVIVAVILVPITLIRVGVTQATIREVSASVQARQPSPGLAEAVVPMLVVTLFGMLAQTLMNGALAKGVSLAYIGQESSVGGVYRFVLPKLGALVLAGILVALVTTVGFLLLIVPGIIFALWYALTAQCVVVEGVGASEGMRRSKQLVSGNLGKVFLVSLVVGLITAIFAQIVNWIAQQAFVSAPESNAPVAIMATMRSQLLVQEIAQLVAGVLTMPISAGAFILLYYDLRIRKEGFDLEMLARAVGAQGAGGGGPADAGPTI
jgi:hypothetical protein